MTSDKGGPRGCSCFSFSHTTGSRGSCSPGLVSCCNAFPGLPSARHFCARRTAAEFVAWTSTRARLADRVSGPSGEADSDFSVVHISCHSPCSNCCSLLRIKSCWWAPAFFPRVLVTRRTNFGMATKHHSNSSEGLSQKAFKMPACVRDQCSCSAAGMCRMVATLRRRTS